MKVDAIYGKLLALTKEYHFRDPGGGASVRKFISGRKRSWPLPGFGMTWWLTKAGIRRRDELARMVMRFDPQLRAGDLKSFSRAIEDFFKEHATDSTLFHLLHGLTTGALTLFDTRSLPEREFAEALWQRLRAELLNTIATWLVIVPLLGVKSASTSMGFDGISLLAANDADAWTRISTRYSDARLWNPTTGARDVKDMNVFRRPALPSTWLLCEASGTETGANQLAKRRMRTFLALVFSHLAGTVPSLLTKSASEPSRMSTQFPDDSSRVECGQAYLPIGTVLPAMLTDIEITPDLIATIQEWYRRRDAAPQEQQERAIASSHFVHYAILGDNLERFIYFFIALDALFGVQGAVESSIIAGVGRIFHGDASWPARTRHLFDLRSELLHGGSSSVDDWKDMEHYTRHFDAEPIDDVGIAAMTSLRKFFD